MDKVVSKITALGVPGLIILVAVSSTGLYGAAALTATLAMLGGPAGMLGGLASLGLIGLISESLAKYGFDAIFSVVVKNMINNGETKESVLSKIDKYPVSGSLKSKLKKEVNKYKW